MRQTLDLCVINLAGFFIQAVLRRIVNLAGEINLGSVREVPAVREAHPKDVIARVEQRHVHRGVGLRTRVRLHVGVGRAEQLLDALDGEALGHVHVFTAAVIALAGITLGIFIGQLRTLGLQHAGAGVVLGGDQLNVVFLAAVLVMDGDPQLIVETLDGHVIGEH